VLFIDEAYSLVSGSSDAFGKEALETVMRCMEDMREELVVILAGYPSDMQRLLQVGCAVAAAGWWGGVQDVGS
jgi:stage V sporulation protein K